MLPTLLPSVLSLSALAVISSLILVIASKRFAVEVDPKVELLAEILPGANCGACGYPGCKGYAEALAAGTAEGNLCSPGGAAVASEIGRITGRETVVSEPMVARIGCMGGTREAVRIATYEGIRDCRTAALVSTGEKACPYSCLGLGTCEVVCPFDAIYMDDNGLPVVIESRCTGCGICVEECPRDVIFLAPRHNRTYVRCISQLKPKETKQVCSAGCIACRLCEKNCSFGAITVEDNVARIDPELCVDCKLCGEVCPVKSIVMAPY